MASLARCSSCRGFVPAGLASCPNCGLGVGEPTAGLADRLGFWIKAAGGASVAMTLMACYGVPVMPDDPDTDPSEGTGGSTGDTPTTSAESSSTGAAESSTGAAESSTGAGSTGGSETGGSETGTDGSTGAGAVDERPLPRRAG